MLNYTPWGAIQTQREVAPGITLVSTASHGGYHLSAERVTEMPDGLRDIGTWAGNDGVGGRWFEEDVDWALVALSFPDHFEPYSVFCALRTYRSTLTDKFDYECQARYATERGETPPPPPPDKPDLFQGPRRDRVEEIVAAYRAAHAGGWEKGGSCTTDQRGQVRAFFQNLHTGERATRILDSDTFYTLPPVVDELPESMSPTATLDLDREIASRLLASGAVTA